MTGRQGGALLLGLAVCVIAGAAARADGVDAASFVRDGVGARAFGLGGAFVAIAEGPSAGFWNAASLADLEGITAGSMYTDRFGLGIAFQSISASTTVTDGLGVELGWIRSSIDDIPITGDEGDGVFSESQNLMQAGIGYRVLDRELGQTESRVVVSLGGGFKMYTHTLLEGRGSGPGFDLSALATFACPWGSIRLGWCSQDTLGTVIQWRGTDHNPENDVPWMNRIGVAVGLLDGHALLATSVDLAVGRAHLTRYRFGVEATLVPEFAIRAGASISPTGAIQVAMGGSIHWHAFALDYAYMPNAILGASHIFTLEIALDELLRGGEGE
ncbi:MAG: hypothetical protein NTX23_06240 [Candidatus Bipolaricaulota bacterium]|nr:hypothetical protein [Candidatus Bipolaricaulota bacterium]